MDLFHIPDLILKLRIISLTTGKMVPDRARAMERTTNFSIIFYGKRQIERINPIVFHKNEWPT